MKNFTLGILVGVLLVGCAGFSYKYYGLSADSYEGKLLGPKPEDDLPFAECKPTDADKSPCVVVKAKVWFALKTDYEQMEEALKACQSPHRDIFVMTESSGSFSASLVNDGNEGL